LKENYEGFGGMLQACVCQLKKRIELRHKVEKCCVGDTADKTTITRICIDLCSIKSATTLSDGRGLFLAMRLRHPPHLSKCFQERSALDSGTVNAALPKYELVADPSKAIGAFGSPTAHFCVGFASKRDYDEAAALLQKARVRVFSAVHELATPMERRPRSHTLCSHRLPNEHVAEGMRPALALDAPVY
jgi:hypothetical protein